jgi:hypothetical protein
MLGGYQSRASAWGNEGHEVIGRIAGAFLEPAVRERVDAILATDSSGLTHDTGIGPESTWADHYRDSDRETTQQRYRGTRNWHFVDLELERADLAAACFGHPILPPGTAASMGPAEDCIVDKIEQFRAELANRLTAPAERLLALQFLLHLVGDIHQPLHACDDHDKGGNARYVTGPGLRGGNLHHDWDVEFVARLGSDPIALATSLVAAITPAERERLGGGADDLNPEHWALESYALARDHAYLPLGPADADGRTRLTEAYIDDATAIVKLQLLRAGVRLAALLNQTLR